MFGKKKRGAEGAMFSARIRSVFHLARAEAARLGHDYVGTEHLLLGLLLDAEGVHASILTRLGVDGEELGLRVEDALPGGGPERAGSGAATGGGESLPWTSRAKKAIDAAIAEARELGDSLVDTEHLLLGLTRDVRSIAALALDESGVGFGSVRSELQRLRGEAGPGSRGRAGSPGATGGGAAEDRAGSAESGAAFALSIDDHSDRTIYEQIVGQLKEAAATGRLRAGERLPPLRELADRLGIAPGTVARAYRELEERGLVVTRGTRGSFVTEGPRERVTDTERPEVLVGLLRPVAVAAFHLGATEAELRTALEGAMEGIFEGEGGDDD